mmetsp:Transcript_494/g.651  ORF Transcript_494/g.651 Transcript_494/m.651 type:complete len:271 (+) Transcript_494:426-1238(+)
MRKVLLVLKVMRGVQLRRMVILRTTLLHRKKQAPRTLTTRNRSAPTVAIRRKPNKEPQKRTKTLDLRRRRTVSRTTKQASKLNRRKKRPKNSGRRDTQECLSLTELRPRKKTNLLAKKKQKGGSEGNNPGGKPKLPVRRRRQRRKQQQRRRQKRNQKGRKQQRKKLRKSRKQKRPRRKEKLDGSEGVPEAHRHDPTTVVVDQAGGTMDHHQDAMNEVQNQEGMIKPVDDETTDVEMTEVVVLVMTAHQQDLALVMTARLLEEGGNLKLHH